MFIFQILFKYLLNSYILVVVTRPARAWLFIWFHACSTAELLCSSGAHFLKNVQRVYDQQHQNKTLNHALHSNLNTYVCTLYAVLFKSYLIPQFSAGTTALLSRTQEPGKSQTLSNRWATCTEQWSPFLVARETCREAKLPQQAEWRTSL